MVGANLRSRRHRARQFCKRLPIPVDASGIRDTAMLFFIGRVEVSATAFGNLDDAMIVVATDLRHEIVDAAGPMRPDFLERAQHQQQPGNG